MNKTTLKAAMASYGGKYGVGKAIEKAGRKKRKPSPPWSPDYKHRA